MTSDLDPRNENGRFDPKGKKYMSLCQYLYFILYILFI